LACFNAPRAMQRFSYSSSKRKDEEEVRRRKEGGKT
jgi:hypothetical protein